MIVPGEQLPPITTPPDIIRRGRFDPSQERHYVHLPFVVPSGVHQIHLRCDYNARIDSDPLLRGGNTLDLGLFDEQGTDAGGPGFRGWSGSERLAITIDEAWATPPYRPGPIGAGIWHVLLGPYKVAPTGLNYEIAIWFNPGLPPDLPPRMLTGLAKPAQIVPAAEPGWVRGDLHCHSLYSDGDSWPDEVAFAAASAGLDFLAITDHNSAMRPHLPPNPALPVLIPGIEVTTYGGHWNVWGVEGWFDFREPSPEAVAREMERAVALGGLMSINHPKPFGPPWTYGEPVVPHLVEVWNGNWERLNTIALRYWEDRLRRGERLVAVGGSDAHFVRPRDSGPLPPARLGTPTTWVRITGPLTVNSVLQGLRQGHSFISESPSGPQLYVSADDHTVRVHIAGGAGSALHLVTECGCVAAAAIESDDWLWQTRYPASARYVRVQIVDVDGRIRALSNPLWLDNVG
ncbi:MAG: hypothetical protein C4346_04800 [Chloroflexota bacterium]